jgi:D-alanyl-D-alanine carboxypeptidase (penicillin-binding protein 5/6)
MNKKAAALGMTHTKFANSYGLDEPGHYSTAADLAVLGRYAMANPTFRNIVRKEATAIGQGSGRRRLETSNYLLGRYRGANGIKTGWTNDAGYSVVASANRGGEQLVAVVLGTRSESARFAAASKLLDWGFSHVRRESLVASGSVLGRAQVTDYDDRFVPVLASQGSTPTIFDLDGTVRTTVRFDRRIKAPVVRGARLGVLVATQGDRLVASVPLVAGASVPAPGFFERISIGLHRWWSRIVG